MLIQFSVGNFRSFSDIQTFSLVAAPLSSFGDLDQSNVFAAGKDFSLLRSAAVYGANASGKSNLFRALNFLKVMASKSLTTLEEGESIPTEPFLLSTETENEPSFFEIIFMVGKKQYRYGMEADANTIVSEWLYHKPSSRESALFVREGQEIKSNKVSFKEGVPLEKSVAPNHSFLAVCATLQGKIAQSIVNWFRNLNVVSGLKDRSYTQYTLGQLIRGEDKSEIEEFLRKLDVCLDRVKLEFPEGAPKIPRKGQVRVNLVSSSEVPALLESDEKATPLEILMPTPKWDEAGKIVGEANLHLAQHASEGTQKLFAFSGPLVDTLKHGKILFVDEFDARLHPIMSCALVKLFNSPETNPRNAQLVFATHDTNLLSSRLLRRDQIWFAEKDEQGATNLYSLAQFRLENGELPRKDSSFESDYIRGKFGAIPFIGDLAEIFTRDAASKIEKEAALNGQN